MNDETCNFLPGQCFRPAVTRVALTGPEGRQLKWRLCAECEKAITDKLSVMETNARYKGRLHVEWSSVK